MKFLLDMGVSPRVREHLSDLGHVAVHLQEKELGKLLDSQILKKARATRSIVLPHDLDFGNLLAASGEALPSVVIFRLRNMRPDNVIDKLTHVLSECSDALEEGAVISVGDALVRIRQLPINPSAQE